MSDDEHVMDGPLGDIAEIALALAYAGHTEIALKLAIAHDAIQKYLVEEDDRLDQSTQLALRRP
jgi:hypothetical protein